MGVYLSRAISLGGGFCRRFYLGEQAYAHANCHNECNRHTVADAHLNSNIDGDGYADPEQHTNSNANTN